MAEEEKSKEKSGFDHELTIMRRMGKQLSQLQPSARPRVLRFLSEAEELPGADATEEPDRNLDLPFGGEG